MKKKEIKKIKNNFSYWENLISQYWNINGKFLKLNSEFDLNFEVIDPKNNKFIVKIMRNDCDEGFLEGQIRFLKFINKTCRNFCRQINNNFIDALLFANTITSLSQMHTKRINFFHARIETCYCFFSKFCQVDLSCIYQCGPLCCTFCPGIL